MRLTVDSNLSLVRAWAQLLLHILIASNVTNFAIPVFMISPFSRIFFLCDILIFGFDFTFAKTNWTSLENAFYVIKFSYASFVSDLIQGCFCLLLPWNQLGPRTQILGTNMGIMSRGYFYVTWIISKFGIIRCRNNVDFTQLFLDFRTTINSVNVLV